MMWSLISTVNRGQDACIDLVGMRTSVFRLATVFVILLFSHASGRHTGGCCISNLHHVSDW